MEGRPKLKIELNKKDEILEITGWISICAIWLLTAINYQNLPDIIPIHYNSVGKADGYGDKWMIFTLPLIATILFIGLSILNRYPHMFNYPVKITADNAMKQYSIATRMIRYLKLMISLIFGLISYQTINHANGQEDGLGIWFLPLAIGLVFTPIVYFSIKSSAFFK
jgi:uncharacterized membrane protein